MPKSLSNKITFFRIFMVTKKVTPKSDLEHYAVKRFFTKKNKSIFDILKMDKYLSKKCPIQNRIFIYVFLRNRNRTYV